MPSFSKGSCCNTVTLAIGSEDREHIQRVLNPAKRSGHLDSLNHVAYLLQGLSSDRQSLFSSCVLVGNSVHPFQHRFGDDYTGDFVGKEFGVAVADQGPDSGDDRDAASLDSPQEALELSDVECRLRYREFSSRLDFPLEPAQLVVQIDCAGIHPDSYVKRGGPANRVTADVQAVVQAGHHVDEADRVYIKDSGSLGIRAH